MFLSVNGLNTFYTKEDGNNAVLFLHGWGCDGKSLTAVISRIKRKAVVLDFWGFGQSSPPPTAWGVREYAKQTEAFCEKLGLSKVDIVAHSFGGRVAVALAAMYPERVEKLVLISGAGLRRFSLKRSIKEIVYKTGRLFKKNIKGGSVDYQEAKGIMRSVLVKAVRDDLSKCAKRINAPTLLIYGDKDTAVPLWIMKKYNKLISNSGCVTVKGGAHFCYVTHADFVSAAINSFLGEK